MKSVKARGNSADPKLNSGLKERYKKAILDILTANPRVERIVLFDSRVMGIFTPKSDIDLVLYGDGLTLTDLAKLKEKIKKNDSSPKG